MPFCTVCGTYMDSGDVCPQCGTPVDACRQMEAGREVQIEQPPQYYEQGQQPAGGPGTGFPPPGYGVQAPKSKFPIWIFVVAGIVVMVAFFGLFIAITVPVYMNARGNAQRRVCQANMRTIDGAIQSYEAMFDKPGTYPDSLDDMMQPGTKTLRSIPTCPCGGGYVWIEGAPPYVSCPNNATHTIQVYGRSRN
ncbi:MAG: hypothetical protein JXA49_03695 [Actinobacteria bacterium]|nr:hypothetical protein [Actinomycetota bacterium]